MAKKLWKIDRELKALWKLYMVGNITYKDYWKKSQPLRQERKLILMKEESGWSD